MNSFLFHDFLRNLTHNYLNKSIKITPNLKILAMQSKIRMQILVKKKYFKIIKPLFGWKHGGMHYLFIFFKKTRLWTKNFHFLYIPQLFFGTKPETQKNSHSHQTILMVPNPSIQKQENKIHPTKNQKKVTIITKESRREPEDITD